eukprot:1633512-Prymnesium_polylepis.2
MYCKLHHRATSRAERGEESCGAGPASSRQLSGRSAVDVSEERQYIDREGRHAVERTVYKAALKTPASPHCVAPLGASRQSSLSEPTLTHRCRCTVARTALEIWNLVDLSVPVSSDQSVVCRLSRVGSGCVAVSASVGVSGPGPGVHYADVSAAEIVESLPALPTAISPSKSKRQDPISGGAIRHRQRQASPRWLVDVFEYG